MSRLIYRFLIVILFLPAWQGLTSWINIRPLKGSIEVLPQPVFNLKDWFSGIFQSKYYPYQEQQTGFRQDLVRLNNQIDFSFFRIIHAQSVVLGKDDCLFELNYIKDYTGESFIGEKAVDEKVAKLKALYDTLKRKNIDLLVVLAPGKASFFPENIPDQYTIHGIRTSNYLCLSRTMKDAALPFIDFNRYFLDIRDTVSWPLYHKGGIHWSMYGMSLCMDSLFRYIGHIRGIRMVDFGWDGLEISQSLKYTDNDIADGLNLFQRLYDRPGAYPRWTFKEQPGCTKPDVIVVADSYYWSVFGNALSARMFNKNIFWYYFNEEYIPEQAVRKISDLDVKASIEQNQVIILMATEANLDRFPFGFIEQAYPLYFK